jgi:acyl-CoA thioester hydrolase
MVSKTEIKVSFQDTDQAGVVHFANFFRYFGIGMIEFLRTNGLIHIIESIRDGEVHLPIIEAHCEFKAPAKFDDVISLNTELKIRDNNLVFEYKIIRQSDDKVLAFGYTVNVFANKEWKRIPLPEKIRILTEK